MILVEFDHVHAVALDARSNPLHEAVVLEQSEVRREDLGRDRLTASSALHFRRLKESFAVSRACCKSVFPSAVLRWPTSDLAPHDEQVTSLSVCSPSLTCSCIGAPHWGQKSLTSMAMASAPISSPTSPY